MIYPLFIFSMYIFIQGYQKVQTKLDEYGYVTYVLIVNINFYTNYNVLLYNLLSSNYMMISYHYCRFFFANHEKCDCNIHR